MNAELAAAAVAQGDAAPEAGRAAPGAAPGLGGRRRPRPPLGSASTFAALPAAPPAPAAALVEAETADEPIAVASGAGTTGGNDWGVQLGAFRAKGDAERRLLTTALKDVPELAGGLRRVEPAKVQGATVYRAQFVGLSQSDAAGRLRALARQEHRLPAARPGDLTAR